MGKGCIDGYEERHLTLLVLVGMECGLTPNHFMVVMKTI